MMNDSESLTSREQVLRYLGANDTETEELLAYGTNHFTSSLHVCDSPMEDEEFVSCWQEYAEKASSSGVFAVLRKHLIQLNFPIQAGISQTIRYRQAVRQGLWDEKLFQEDGLDLCRADGIQLFVHQTPAGKIPVIVAVEREDFVSLLQALSQRNEPATVPDSQGAAILSGYNNWGRIAAIKAQMQTEFGERFHEKLWHERFKQLIPQKKRYQDTFILLSRDYYSGVRPDSFDLDEEEWRRMSLQIRLEHESVHYVTKRLLGSMRNTVQDELLADCAGLVAATGQFRAEWFLAFIGLENYPSYREGGRLQNYRGTPLLSDGAFQILQPLVYYAAHYMESVITHYQAEYGEPPSTHWLMKQLTSTSLEELAEKWIARSSRWRSMILKSFSG